MRLAKLVPAKLSLQPACPAKAVKGVPAGTVRSSVAGSVLASVSVRLQQGVLTESGRGLAGQHRPPAGQLQRPRPGPGPGGPSEPPAQVAAPSEPPAQVAAPSEPPAQVAAPSEPPAQPTSCRGGCRHTPAALGAPVSESLADLFIASPSAEDVSATRVNYVLESLKGPLDLDTDQRITARPVIHVSSQHLISICTWRSSPPDPVLTVAASAALGPGSSVPGPSRQHVGFSAVAARRLSCPTTLAGRDEQCSQKETNTSDMAAGSLGEPATRASFCWAQSRVGKWCPSLRRLLCGPLGDARKVRRYLYELQETLASLFINRLHP
ncbi:hypothetical protein AB1E19_010342 [Capra hircus]